MSSSNNDEQRLARWHLGKEQQDRLIERFKDRNDPVSILVVCDMLLTGFDAPVEQVMLCLLFIHPRASNWISLQSAGIMPA